MCGLLEGGERSQISVFLLQCSSVCVCVWGGGGGYTCTSPRKETVMKCFTPGNFTTSNLISGLSGVSMNPG